MAGQFKQGTAESGPTPMTADERVMSQLKGEIGVLVDLIITELWTAPDELDEDTRSLLLRQLEELLETRRGEMDDEVFKTVNNTVWGMRDALAKRDIAAGTRARAAEPVRVSAWPFISL